MTDARQPSPPATALADGEGRCAALPSSVDEATPERSSELRERLTQTCERIASAVAAAGRDDTPTLIVVTKFHPLSDVIALAQAGVSDIGENREQEFEGKVEALRARHPEVLSGLRTHFIGQIQSRKARRIATLADVVQTVDRLKVLERIDAVGQEQSPIDVLLQVDLDGSNAARGGVQVSDLATLADAADAAAGINLRGLMAVAPLGEEPARAFSRLAQVRENFLRDHPHARLLSAGMSQDLEEAVAIGATHLRVGSAILGSRPERM